MACSITEQASISLVPAVLKRGIEIAEHPSHKGRNYSTITIAAPVIIDNQRVYMAVVVKKTGRYRYKTHRVLNPDGSNVKLALKKKELDNLRIANTGQGRSITPSTLSLISENEKVNVEKAQPKFSLKAPVEF